MDNNWIEDESYRNFKIDRIFHRTIFKFHHFTISERLRIVQYPDTNDPTIYYHRFFTIKEEKFFNHIIYRIIGRIFTKLVFKSIEESLSSSKLLSKYKFLRDCIPYIRRDEILEELGI
jgi:hypothetical protein